MDRAGDGRSVMHEMRLSGLVCVSRVCARERREAAGTVCAFFSLATYWMPPSVCCVECRCVHVVFDACAGFALLGATLLPPLFNLISFKFNTLVVPLTFMVPLPTDDIIDLFVLLVLDVVRLHAIRDVIGWLRHM